MGFLRIYLALCVVAAHANAFVPWAMHGGREAVQIFFMISGFYMALIADKYPSKLEFYCSRFLRIFIPYWFVAVGVVLACIVSGIAIDEWGVLGLYRNYSPDNNGLAGVVITAISNVTILLQDAVMFLTNDGGEKLSFTRDFGFSKHPLWLFLVIPQAWSVAVELMFYITVPFIAKLRIRSLVVILLVSVGVRLLAYMGLGLDNDPWTYRFFPFELALFVAGMLGCRFYRAKYAYLKKVVSKIDLQRWWSKSIYVIVLFLLFFMMKWLELLLGKFINENYAVLVIYLLWACLLPFLFAISKSLSWDRFVGELSYPVYLVHVFVISVVGILLKALGWSDFWWGGVSALLSLFAAWLVFAIVISPLDKHRHELAKSMAARLHGNKG